MARFLILHGTDSSPGSNWFRWLEATLVAQGHQVWLPQLPNSDRPDPEKYNKLLLSNKTFIFDEDTVLIGHSSGSVAALHLLQALPNKSVIKGAILVSAFKNDLGWDALKCLFTVQLDFTNIKMHCSNFLFIHSDNDPYCPVEHAQFLAQKTFGELIIFKGQGHFNTELGPQYTQFPKILDSIYQLI